MWPHTKTLNSDIMKNIIKKILWTALGIVAAVIIIGGAYGFDDEIRAKADLVWSFSKLVFPHMLFRVMVTEQIYRAQEIYLGHAYHHE